MAMEPMTTVTMAGQTFEIVDKVAREKGVTSTDDGAGNVTILEGTDSSGGGGGATITSYMSLTDKPTIEGVTLAGDKFLEDFNLKTLSNIALENMLKED